MRRRGGPERWRGSRAALVLATLAFATSALLVGCDLQELTIVDFSDVVVAEVYVTLREPPEANTVMAFLHGNSAGGQPDSRTFDDAVVRVVRGDGLTLDFTIAPNDDCLDPVPENATGTCFFADAAVAGQLRAGDALDLEITLGAGAGTALGSLMLPGDFALEGVSAQCRLAPDTTYEVTWSVSGGAWAYLNETVIVGLPDALAGEGIEVEDSLYLIGVSVSASDTTVVFPAEFGVFDRFDLEQDLAVRLQQGLPDGTSAVVSISAADRNYVNWVRGGNFNPSGLVRVSSLRGAALGTFGGVIVREFEVLSSLDPVPSVPDCPPPT